MGDHTSVTIVPTLTQHNAFQSRGGWGHGLLMVDPGNAVRWLVMFSLSNPVCNILLSAPLFTYFSSPSGHGPLDLSPVVRCYNKPNVYI